MKNDPIQITREKARSKIEPVETADTITLTDGQTEILAVLADVLEYPGDTWQLQLEVCIDLCALNEIDKSSLAEFRSDSSSMTLLELQELYTRTFDLNPVCALEVGYHLFGEDYKRGEFLAKLRESQNPYELGQERQLPDFMPVVLRLLGKMDDAELRANLIGYCLLPALKKMNETFAKGENPYRKVMGFLDSFLSGIAKDSLTECVQSDDARYQYA